MRLILLFCLLSFSAQAKLKILFVHSYKPGLWAQQTISGTTKRLKENLIEFEYKEFHYDSISVEKERSLVTKKLKEFTSLYNSFQPDHVFVGDDEAAEAFVPYLIRKKASIYVTGINQYLDQTKWYRADYQKLYVVKERYPFSQSLKFLKKININLKEVLVLTSANETSRLIVSQLKDYMNESKSKIKIKKMVISDNWDVWKKAILNYKGKNKAVWYLVSWNLKDSNGQQLDLRKLGKFHRKHSMLPSMGINNVNTLIGLLSSFSVNSEDMAYQATRFLIKNHQGKNASDRVESAEKVRLKINKKRAQTLGLKIPFEILEIAEIEKKRAIGSLK